MWRLHVGTASCGHRGGHNHNNQTFCSKRFFTILVIFSGLFMIFFYRAAQIVHYRVELSRVRFLYQACEEKLKLKSNGSEVKESHEISHSVNLSSLQPLLKKMSGTKAATGFKNIKPLSSSHFILPHLGGETHRLLPSYHMSSGREMVDVVIGITNIKRDKEVYLFNTIRDLVNGIQKEDENSTLIIILLAEPDLIYVLNTTWTIEKEFPVHVKSGLIEVLSPSDSYYPNLDSLPTSLGDSLRRVKWRTKEVLDALYLMSYGHTKGSYYLMMEDDVTATDNYMKDMKKFVTYCTAKEPQWMLIEFSNHFGSLGKLFKSSDVGHFLKFIQLFYYNMPLDFLIESYLRDMVCDLMRNSYNCIAALYKIRKPYPEPLFQHIGLYSSLPGKLGKIEDPSHIKGQKFFPHKNPPVKYIRNDIEELPFHSMKAAYDGKNMFLGMNPRKGAVVEFWFEKPTVLKSYKFQSGNFERKYDIFVQADVEVCLVNAGNFTKVGSFDELGYAGGNLEEYGLLEGIRLKVINFDWEVSKSVVLSQFCNLLIRRNPRLGEKSTCFPQ